MSHLDLTPAPINTPEEANRALALRFIETVDARGGFAAAADMLAPSFTAHVAGVPPLDRDGLIQFGQAFFTGFPDVTHTFEEQIAAGDRVVNRFTVRGTHRGVFQGVPPTGNRIHYEGISIYRIAGGKIAEIWIAADFLSLMQQIGALPAPGQEPG